MNNRLSFLALVIFTSMSIIAMPPKKQPSRPQPSTNKAVLKHVCQIARSEARFCSLTHSSNSYCKETQKFIQQHCKPNK